MLKRAFPTTNHHQYQGTPRWKLRLCYGFITLIIISVAIILIAWNMLCSLPSTNPLLVTEGEANNKLILNESVGGSAAVGPAASRNKHIVEVFYEVLCPDSRYFVIKEFIPAYTQLKDYIKPVFIPYGKASTKSNGGRFTFDCQHGETECQGNMIHACAVAHLTSDEPLLLAYIGCMIDNNRDPEQIGQKCAKQLGIDWAPIKTCWKGTEGPELLKSYGEQTNSLRPAISFIPTIVIDGSQKGQKDILKSLKSFLCSNTLMKENLKDCQDGLKKWRY